MNKRKLDNTVGESSAEQQIYKFDMIIHILYKYLKHYTKQKWVSW